MGEIAKRQRTYQEALDALASLPYNATTIAVAKELGPKEETLRFLPRIGYQARLCTSPHLVSIRERIQINGQLISEGDFARSFFEVWDKLEATKDQGHPDVPMPTPLKMLNLVAYHSFLSIGVDATIMEVQCGGRFDTTNIVPKPIVTGITALGIDHIAILGDNLPRIAWQKAGIFKTGIPAYTVIQPPEALEVIKKEAENVQVSEFYIVEIPQEMSEIKLGLAGTHQRQNASLAMHLVHRFLQLRSPELEFLESLSPIPEVYVAGLKEARWAGRCQRIADPSRQGLEWLLDGAHTTESIALCAEWYFTPELAFRDTNLKRTLLFNCIGDQSGRVFLDTLLQIAAAKMALENYAASHSGLLFDQVIFCTNAINSADLDKKPDRDDLLALTRQREFADTWAGLVPRYPKENVHVVVTIQDAVDWVQASHTMGKSRDVFVCGSLYLIGGLISAAKLEDRAFS